MKIFKTPSFGTGKCDFFIHHTKIIPYNLCRPPFREPGSDSSLTWSKCTLNGLLISTLLSPQWKGMGWMEEEKVDEGMLRQYLTKGRNILGKEGKWIQEDFHYSYAWIQNEIPTPPFIWKKDVYSIGWWDITGGLVGKLPITCEFQLIPCKFLIFATFASIRKL